MADVHIHAPLCIAAGAIFPPLCTSLVAIRFYARKKSSAGYGWDDWLVLPALLMVIGMSAAVLKGIDDKSVGYPTPPETPGETRITATSYEQTKTQSIYWSVELMQLPALTAVKLSFMFFYRRTFRGTGGVLLDIITWTLIAVILVWGIAYFFALLFICPGHPDVYWISLALEEKYCVDTVMLHNSYGISDVVLDLLVILFPVPLIWQLHMPSRKKLGVIGIFALGVFTIVASMFRMVTYLESTAAEFKPGTDTDILVTGGIYWGLVESGIALISACLPTTQGVLRCKVIAKGISVAKSLHSDGQRSGEHTDQSSRGSRAEFASMGIESTIKSSEEIGPIVRVLPGEVLVTRTFGSESQPRPGEIV